MNERKKKLRCGRNIEEVVGDLKKMRGLFEEEIQGCDLKG